MTEQSMFFSDGSYYSQNSFAKFIRDIFGHNGVVDNIDNELSVTANTPTNMAVKVNTGRSYINGYIHEILTDPVSLTIADADTTNPRIDRVILRLDTDSARKISANVLTGTPAASPVAPTLTQTSTIYEISLAQVYVGANVTSISTSNITDERQYMWFNRDNQPKASTTEYGAVKVGYGIDVSNGEISVAGSKLLVNKTSRTNSGGFAVGSYSYTLPGASGSASISEGQNQTVIQNYLPNTPVRTPYNEFAVTDSVMDYAIPTFTITASIVINYTTSAGSSVSVNVYRTSNSESLGSGSWGSLYSSTTYTKTLDVTLPRNWQWGTDTLYVVVSDTSYDSTSTTTCTITAGSASGTVYFTPTTS